MSKSTEASGADPIASATGEWRRGGPVVLAAGASYGVSTFHVASLGALIAPLAARFGWSRGEITGALMFLGFSAIVLNPLAGKLVDRFGARRIALAGIWTYAVTLCGLGLTGPSLGSWYVAWAALALFFPLMCPLVWTAGVVGNFTRRRGLALGLMLTGSGVAAALTPPITVAALQQFGWREAYFLLAALGIAITLPLTLLFFRDGRAARGAADSAAPAGAPGMTLAQAVRTPQFWKLGVALMTAGGVANALQVHLQPMLIDGGASAANAAAMAAVIGPALIVGRLTVGFLLDRVFGPLVAAAALLLPILSMTLLLGYDGTLWRGMLVAAALGLAYGAEIDLLAYLSSRYFGVRNYASIFGALLGLFSFGFALSPMAAGVVFDTAGSYDRALLTMMVLSVVMAALVLTTGRYPKAFPDGAAIGPRSEG